MRAEAWVSFANERTILTADFRLRFDPKPHSLTALGEHEGEPYIGSHPRPAIGAEIPNEKAPQISFARSSIARTLKRIAIGVLL
jgi:hypothetical protein